MHTYVSADEMTLTSGLAVEVQRFDLFVPPDDEVRDDIKIVHYDEDPAWTSPTQMAPFGSWMGLLREWQVAEESEVHSGCLVLSDSRAAHPRTPLLDDRTPTLWLTHCLKTKGWAPINRTLEHTPGATQEFDNRISLRMAPYYRVLLCLDRCFKYCAAIPSQESRTFYEL